MGVKSDKCPFYRFIFLLFLFCFQTPNDNNVDPTSQNNQIIIEEAINLLPTLDCEQIIMNQNMLLQKINNQEKILNTIIEIMQKLTQKVAMLSVQISEGLLETIKEKIDQQGGVVLLKDANRVESESFRLEVIDDKEHLEILERTLMDKAEKTKLRKQLSFLFQPCEGNGITYAYKLLDLLISREFLCKCSWSGASRTDTSKIPLKDFKNFIKFFCDMIRSWDPTFTMAQTEMFFKICLKNAVKRRAMKNLRSSSKRVRKTKLNNQKKNEPVPSTSKGQIHEIDNIEVAKSVMMEVEKEIEEREIIAEEESSDECLC